MLLLGMDHDPEQATSRKRAAEMTGSYLSAVEPCQVGNYTISFSEIRSIIRDLALT